MDIQVSGRLAGIPKLYPHPSDNTKDRVWGMVVWTTLTSLEKRAFVAFGALAHYIVQNKTKGDLITVEGKLAHFHAQNYSEVVASRVDGYAENRGFDFSKDYKTFDTVEKPQWTMKAAYEANKSSDKCVVCGKTLSRHPAVGVLYCKCVENLPK